MRALLGVVSRWQDDNRTPQRPHLAVAKARGIDAVVIQAGHGIADVDPDFAAIAESAITCGLPWTGGWWPEPNESGPVEQADKFWSVVSTVGRPRLPLSLDIEGVETGTVPTSKTYGRWLRDFTDRLIELAGRAPHIYTADWWWDTHVYPSGISFADCDLRVPQWPRKAETPPTDPRQWEAWLTGRQPDPVKGFEQWSAWQFSCRGLGQHFGMESSDVCVNVMRPGVFERWMGSA